MKEKDNGTLTIRIDPEEDLARIEKLPPVAKAWAVRYLLAAFPRAWGELLAAVRKGACALRGNDWEDAWLAIPERGDYRTIARLWCEGHSVREIAGAVSLSEGRVNNILSDLRKRYRLPLQTERKSREVDREVETLKTGAEYKQETPRTKKDSEEK